MLRRLLLVTVLLGLSSLGCGLREQAFVPDGGFGTGKGGATGGGGTGGGHDAAVCTSGSACTPVNACHVGQTACSATGASCTDTQKSQPNGTACGEGKVCSDGICSDCVEGMSCAVTGSPCRTGGITCGTGAPVCTANGDQPNGMSCGNGMVCLSGQCTNCQTGASCVPANACHQGALACDSGMAVCNDKTTPAAAGTGCGTNKVCDGAGTCVACQAGMTCPISGKPCRTGTITCDTGAPVCTESANAANGTTCGANMVCADGTCSPCTLNMTCTPAANPCHAGAMSCSPAITCSDTGKNLSNGSTCGTNKVCNAGLCTACTAGGTCTPTNLCRTGMYSCATGSAVCVEVANVQNGMSCGTMASPAVCNNGTCNPCISNMMCTPPNPCHLGMSSCSTGTYVCNDTGNNASNGTMCGATANSNKYCRAGQCMSCTPTGSCTPNNPCHTGVYSCATGNMTCQDTGNNASDGTDCGTNLVCSSGNCVSCTEGDPCPMSNPCNAGRMSCSSGPRCARNGFQDPGTVCGVAMCSDGTLSTPTCDGSGNCSMTLDQACSSGMCKGDGTACIPGDGGP
ncbi:MAG TPA: hypothetical protein VMT03_04730 [Polyangia bacterium]|nr:hypothetical protein [Polyangia bacterium]